MTKQEQFIAQRNAQLVGRDAETVAAYLAQEKDYDIRQCQSLSAELKADIRIVEGDATVISVNGRIMDHDAWDEYIAARRAELTAAEVEATAEATNPAPTTRRGSGFFATNDLPTAVVIPTNALEELTVPAVKAYLRKTYGYCLARGCTPTVQVDDSRVYVGGIGWGRKLTAVELSNMD